MQINMSPSPAESPRGSDRTARRRVAGTPRYPVPIGAGPVRRGLPLGSALSTFSFALFVLSALIRSTQTAVPAASGRGGPGPGPAALNTLRCVLVSR